LEKGLSPKRLVSELQPAARNGKAANTAKRDHDGERNGPTRRILQLTHTQQGNGKLARS
jgi:hypothetical protein